MSDLDITITFDHDEWIVLNAAALLDGCSTTELVSRWCTDAVLAAATDPNTARLATAIRSVLP